MNVFNAWYYSFNPYIANYERQQPIFQNFMRMSIYPLLSILQISERGYSVAPGEYGTITAGLIGSSLIGIFYLSPFVIIIMALKKKNIGYSKGLFLIAAAIVGVTVSLAIGNEMAMMVTTSLLVIITLFVSAIIFGNHLLFCH
jgi:hypothetical protein